jgi:hypothetical protein
MQTAALRFCGVIDIPNGTASSVEIIVYFM